MYYGSSYYFEYLPFDRLDDDIRMMKEANLNYARVGDSIWALCEPEEGRFELDWLQRILDALHAAGIAVVLATPTYAVPPWLAQTYPEIMAVTPDGQTLRFGGRQNTDFTHPTFRFFAERMIRAFMARYADHPAIVGVQVDNEIGLLNLHNDHVFVAFVADLRGQYGSVEALSDAWGLNYWSHRPSDWSQLWRPGTMESGNTNPSYDLAWRRFQARLCTEYLAWQAEVVREYLRPGQFVTHDMVGGHGRPFASRRQIHGVVDLPAENVPHHAQDGLLNPPSPLPSSYHDATGTHGAQQVFLRCDLGRSPRHRNFIVTEMNSISVGGSAHNFPAYDGQWRLAAYTCLSRGAVGAAYWHWHTLHFGHETYSGGILGHDFLPNRCFDEITQVGAEWREHDDLLTGVDPEAEVGVLYSEDSRFAFAFAPPLAQPGSFAADATSYERIFDAFYRSFFDAGAQLEVALAGEDLSRFRVLVVPALYVSDDETLRSLDEYARNGGHLVLSFRTGYADENACARTDVAPGPLREAVGAHYNLFSNVLDPLPVVSDHDGLDLPATARACGWADELVVDSAEPLVTYDHPHFGRFPAVVTRAHGSGRVTYLGTLPDPSLGAALATWVMGQAGVTSLSAGMPRSVRITRAQAKSGERLWFVTNWSWETHAVTLPVHGRSLFSTGDTTDHSTTLSLGPWDVQVVVEAAEPRRNAT